ncbi:MAG TPA: methyltransferase domain-containing protein [Allocoleopsis sp.]
MADYLKVVASHLHPELVSPLALSHIQALAQNLPPCSLAGFECRLSAEQSNVDFQVNLGSWLPHAEFATNLSNSSYPIWKAFQDFCQEWTDPTSLLHRNIDNLWLEFDLDEQPSEVPTPCVFLALNQKIVSEAQELMQITLRLLNYPTSLLLESNLRLCVDSLPSDAIITHLGAMLSRPNKVVRLNVKGIPPENLLDYLMQIGWKDQTNELSILVSTLSEFVDNVVLTFDVGETIHPRIGLECFLEKQPRFEPRWQLFLDYLVERGLCTAAKQNAVLDWPGFSQKAELQDLWPMNLTWSHRLLGSNALSIFWRAISFIKIVYHSGIPLEAKGYLAFGHNWFNVSALTQSKLQKTEVTNQTSWLKSEENGAEVSQYIEQVRSYYDRMNPLILKYVGKTYQSGLLTNNSNTDFYRETNLYCAAQAGIQSGYYILDAGCGVCGPSIDITQQIEGVRIEAITLSVAQANTAKKLVQQARLAERIQVHVGDFHNLPFANEVFNLVFFLESIGYSYDYQRLFAEVYRVLRPGGSLYIKDVFSKEFPLSNQEQQELAEFDRVYAQKTPSLSKVLEKISGIGFEKVISRDLSEILSAQEFNNAMIEFKNGFSCLTEFGKFHYRQFQCLPIFFGEIKAYKPS